MLIEPKRLGSGWQVIPKVDPPTAWPEPAKSLNKLTINKDCNLNTYVGKARLGNRALHCRSATLSFLVAWYHFATGAAS